MVRLTIKQLSALKAVSRFSEKSSVKWASAGDLGTSPQVMGSLVRKGLVNSTTQEERPLHQGVIRYGWYQINDAGLAALSPSPQPKPEASE